MFNIKEKVKACGIRGFRLAALVPLCLCAFPFFTSCSDFINQDSDRVILDGKDHLNNAEDTLYSVVGIVNKLQAIADRTILLGEVRGDLSDITNYTSADLRDVALFNVKDTTNAYNSPADYYAVINNCNYFIAHADTALKNNRNEYIFRKEYAAVKAFRAWTYMQMAQVYGQVPFVTDPILSKAADLPVFPQRPQGPGDHREAWLRRHPPCRLALLLFPHLPSRGRHEPLAGQLPRGRFVLLSLPLHPQW